MPEINEIRRASEIGKKYGDRGSGSYIWQACEECGKERWVQYIVYKKKPRNVICKSCSAKKNVRRATKQGVENVRWNGGIWRKDGYINVRLTPDEQVLFSSMVGVRGYVREHRLVMAKHINRCLKKWEIVHHKNGIRDDNRIGNLELLPSEAHHCPSKMWEHEIIKRDNKIVDLEKQVAALKQQLTEATK